MTSCLIKIQWLTKMKITKEHTFTTHSDYNRISYVWWGMATRLSNYATTLQK